MEKPPKQFELEYKSFIADTGGRCWRCGRTERDKPLWWFAKWRIDPHHFVSHPRRNDRRAVLPLCARCHGVQHTGPYAADPNKFDKLTLAELLAIKKWVDPDYYDRKFLLTCINGVYLPPAVSYLRAAKISWAVRQRGET